MNNEFSLEDLEKCFRRLILTKEFAKKKYSDYIFDMPFNTHFNPFGDTMDCLFLTNTGISEYPKFMISIGKDIHKIKKVTKGKIIELNKNIFYSLEEGKTTKKIVLNCSSVNIFLDYVCTVLDK